MSRPSQPVNPGVLYVVATPLGNLKDISERAIEILRQVDLIAAEDTRHTARLLQAIGVTTPLMSFHDFSTQDRLDALVDRLGRGQSLALVSDAGTPCISDPGYELVRQARHRTFDVVPIPGPSALTAALSVSGLPSDRFVFEGFLPAKREPRRARLAALESEERTLILYESTHRIVDCLTDLAEVMGPDRDLFLGRELTKMFETSSLTSVGECLQWLQREPNQRKGEFVLVVAGKPRIAESERTLREGLRVLDLLADELSLKSAARLAADISGAPRNALYKAALAARKGDEAG